ncbi:MAG: FGGY family carbohydrate kinase, partial [bacterium]
MAAARFLAVDLGASSGRLVAGAWDGARFALEEVHRFPNGPVRCGAHWHTDVRALWAETRKGFAAFAARSGGGPEAVGVDSWGVDYGLLGRDGGLLGLPYHYRDGRTDGMMERVFARVPRRAVFEATGIQFMQINTLYQLAAAREAGELDAAEALLLTPDLFHYWMTDRRVAEYTIASTSQLLDARTRAWAAPLLAALELPARLLPPVVMPGSVL